MLICNLKQAGYISMFISWFDCQLNWVSGPDYRPSRLWMISCDFYKHFPYFLVTYFNGSFFVFVEMVLSSTIISKVFLTWKRMNCRQLTAIIAEGELGCFFFIIKREGRKTIVVEVYTVGSSCIFDTTTLKIESWQLWNCRRIKNHASLMLSANCLTDE